MTKKQNKLDFVSEKTRTKYVNEIIAYFQDERNEAIGVIAAENILDFFLATFGDEIYKKAINDCKKLLREKLEDLEVELEILTPTK